MRRFRMLARVGAPLLALPLLVPLAGPVAAEVTPQDPGPACADAPAERFPDVSGVHEPGIDCIGWWGVTQGAADGTYDPAGPVRRDQMATFVARVIGLSGGELPDAPSEDFSDIAGNVHEPAIRQLATIGVIGGVGDGNYAPAGAVNRAQMGSFLARAWQARTGETLPIEDGISFPDLDGNVHADNILRIASAGFTGGTGAGTYDPAGVVTRAQMGTFLARFLAALVEAGVTDYPPSDPVPLPVDDPDPDPEPSATGLQVAIAGEEDARVGEAAEYTITTSNTADTTYCCGYETTWAIAGSGPLSPDDVTLEWFINGAWLELPLAVQDETLVREGEVVDEELSPGFQSDDRYRITFAQAGSFTISMTFSASWPEPIIIDADQLTTTVTATD